jgi:uncharacterized protein YfaP (DUF2135 family)
MLHQITTGTTGADWAAICTSAPSMGRFTFYSNMFCGFSQVHVDENEFTVRILGVN